MLFKEKLLLSNCDSVRALPEEEVRKRFLTGLTFADGVVLSPNALIDNDGLSAIIRRKNVVKYLNEEGAGKFIIRGFGLADGLSLVDYFDALPDDYIVSSLPSAPLKKHLSVDQLSQIHHRLDATQKALDAVTPLVQCANIQPDSLRSEIVCRISTDDCIGNFFQSDGERILFLNRAKEYVSRSQWYHYSEAYFGKTSMLEVLRFRAEVIDPAYNSLFAKEGEGFLQDNIKVINNIPPIILDSGVLYKSLRSEIQYIEYPIKAFELISSLGTGELVKYLTDEALGYIEDKMKEKGEGILSRKNWFGMYNLMTKKIGLEVK